MLTQEDVRKLVLAIGMVARHTLRPRHDEAVNLSADLSSPLPIHPADHSQQVLCNPTISQWCGGQNAVWKCTALSS